MASSPLAYTIEAADPAAGDMRPFAKGTCAECGNRQRINVTNVGNRPALIQQLFSRVGWDFDAHKPSKCFCPGCVRKRIERRAGESPKDPVPVPAKPRIPGLMDNVKAGLAETARITVSSPKKDEARTLKDLAAAQKSSLRTALESYFDPDSGQYSDGMNDHTISEELGIPRALVAEFRDTFYGELKQDPEIMAFVQQMEEAKKVLANLQSTFNKMELKLEQLLKKNGM